MADVKSMQRFASKCISIELAVLMANAGRYMLQYLEVWGKQPCFPFCFSEFRGRGLAFSRLIEGL